MASAILTKAKAGEHTPTTTAILKVTSTMKEIIQRGKVERGKLIARNRVSEIGQEMITAHALEKGQHQKMSWADEVEESERSSQLLKQDPQHRNEPSNGSTAKDGGRKEVSISTLEPEPLPKTISFGTLDPMVRPQPPNNPPLLGNNTTSNELPLVKSVVIPMSKNEEQLMCSKWEHCIIVQLWGKILDQNTLMRKLENIWKLKLTPCLLNIGLGFFVTSFGCVEDRWKALLHGITFIDGHFLSVRPWLPRFIPMIALTEAVSPVWIKLDCLPIEFFEKSMLVKIGNCLGEFIGIDHPTHNLELARYARICVVLDLNNPPPPNLSIGGFLQSFTIEGTSGFCQGCGKISHSSAACPRQQITPMTHFPAVEDDWVTVKRQKGRKPVGTQTNSKFENSNPDPNGPGILGPNPLGSGPQANASNSPTTHKDTSPAKPVHLQGKGKDKFSKAKSKSTSSTSPTDPLASSSVFLAGSKTTPLPRLNLSQIRQSLAEIIPESSAPLNGKGKMPIAATPIPPSYSEAPIHLQAPNTLTCGNPRTTKILTEEKTTLRENAETQSKLERATSPSPVQKNHPLPTFGAETNQASLASPQTSSGPENPRDEPEPKQSEPEPRNPAPGEIPDRAKDSHSDSFEGIPIQGAPSGLVGTWPYREGPTCSVLLSVEGLVKPHGSCDDPSPMAPAVGLPDVTEPMRTIQVHSRNQVTESPILLPHHTFLANLHDAEIHYSITGNLPGGAVLTGSSRLKAADVCVTSSLQLGEGTLEHKVTVTPYLQRHPLNEDLFSSDSNGSVGQNFSSTSLMDPINIFAWNVRGAASDDFRRVFRDIARRHNPSVVLLTETRVTGDRADGIISTLGYDGFHKVDPMGFAGGLWLLWDTAKVNLIVLGSSFQGITATLEVSNHNPFLVTFVYASPDKTKRTTLWNELIDLAGIHSLPWLVCGDFNDILETDEKWGGGCSTFEL
ncbi:uncharacterized protein G2W53_005712 [Senna tora]|uniref:DUF4283 domain-containing protein n=1 Tax=Senna tora TaxID=362788 RepID=A0A834X2U1_9FABA|nr:uncharacterized protein G2W53_005712 [Senna tora]